MAGPDEDVIGIGAAFDVSSVSGLESDIADGRHRRRRVIRNLSTYFFQAQGNYSF
jgi:hypothetical protein